MITPPEHAEVVVIGGGIVGTSIAHHLAEAGVSDVVLLDADGLGDGSSGKPIGGLRGHFSDATNIALAARSLQVYGQMGDDLRFDRVGYLFLLRTAAQMRQLEHSVALQNAAGLPTRVVSMQEARALCPPIDPDRYVAATFSPTDGHALPRLAIEHWARTARKRGAQIIEHCAVTGVDVHGGEVCGVRTAHGLIRTSTVVCAAGAWSAQIGAMAGVALDVRPVRRQIAFTEPRPGGHRRMPFTIDLETSFYLHNANEGLLLGYSGREQAEGFSREYDDAWLPELRRLAAECVPGLADLPVLNGWAGLYEQTPDSNALIGEAPDVARFLYATGFSGHGFSQAPAAGETIRDLVLGRLPIIDVTALRAERFAENAPILEATTV